MDLWDGLRIVLRRWKVALPIFLAFAIIAFLGSGMINAEYSAGGSVILLGPNSQAAGGADEGGDTSANPWLTGCNTCETVARAIQLSLASTEAKQSVADDGLSTDYTLVVENRSPLITLTATSGSPATAVDTVSGVIDRINAELEVRQSDASAPSDQRITASVLSQDAVARGDYGGRTKARIALLAAGALTAAATALLLEGFSFKRRERVDDYDDDPDDTDDYGDYGDVRHDGAHVARHGPRPASSTSEPNGYNSWPGVGSYPEDPARPRA